MFEDASKSRVEQWTQFGSTSHDDLLGKTNNDDNQQQEVEDGSDSNKLSMYPYMKMNCDELRELINKAKDVEEEARLQNREGLTAREEALKEFDQTLKEWSTQKQEGLETFGNEVLHMNTPVEMLPPLPPVEFDETPITTQPHDILLQELHDNNKASLHHGGSGSTLELTMLRRVENLLKAHAMAVEKDEFPFHDPTEYETAETPLDPLAYEAPPSAEGDDNTNDDDNKKVLSLDEEDGQTDGDINPLLGHASQDFELGAEISDSKLPVGSKF
jgi:hypothetical protein